jgi:hypothetical protein
LNGEYFVGQHRVSLCEQILWRKGNPISSLQSSIDVRRKAADKNAKQQHQTQQYRALETIHAAHLRQSNAVHRRRHRKKTNKQTNKNKNKTKNSTSRKNKTKQTQTTVILVEIVSAEPRFAQSRRLLVIGVLLLELRDACTPRRTVRKRQTGNETRITAN